MPSRPSPISRRSFVGVLTVIAATGCSDIPGPVPGSDSLPPAQLLSALIVSNPVTSPGTPEPVAYVSLRPGITVPTAGRLVITTRRTGAVATAEMVNGGFDPVPLSATAGDTLDVRAEPVGGGEGRRFFAVVPSRQSPVVVRSNPRSQDENVPLSVLPLVVFSEPIDPTTLPGLSVQVLPSDTPVAGAVGFGDSTHLRVMFAPAEPLVADAGHSVRVTPGIADLDGDTVAMTVMIEFRTTPATRLAFSSEPPAYTLADGAWPAVEVSARLPSGHVVTSFTGPVSLAIASGPQGATLGGTTTRAAVAGIARFTDLSIRLPGVDYTLAASAAGATPVTSRPFENVAPPQGEIAFVGGRPAAPEIFVVHTDGSGLRRLASGDHPAWSPDGARLAFTSGPIGEGEVVYYTNGQVALVNADGSGLAILGRGAHPAWSPDGSRIAFTSSADWETTQRSDIYVMNTDGSGLAALNETVFEGVLPWAEQPAWSPDGNTIAFVASPDVENLPSRMYAMNPDGSNVRSLPQPDDRPWVLTQCCVSWSPDGTRFLFWSWMRGWRVMRSDGAGGADALPADPEWTSRPAWSPDGRWMAQTIRGQLTLSYGDRVIRIPIGHSGRNPAWRPAHADGGQVP